MARAATLKHIRKAGEFTTGQLNAGEIGVNTTAAVLMLSADGSAIVTVGNQVWVEHGATAGTARPAGGTAIRVVWNGSVQPTNAILGDRWVKTVDDWADWIFFATVS